MASHANAIAVHQHDFEAENEIAGDAVLQRARSPGVFGDVATQGAVGQACRVGGIEQAALLDGLLILPRDHAWFHDADEVGRINVPDGVHARKREHNSILFGNATAALAAPRAARRDPDLIAAGPAQSPLDILHRSRFDDGQRKLWRRKRFVVAERD